MELYLMHYGDQNSKAVQKGGDICICKADSFCCILETIQHCKATTHQQKLIFKKGKCTKFLQNVSNIYQLCIYYKMWNIRYRTKYFCCLTEVVNPLRLPIVWLTMCISLPLTLIL